MEKIILDTDIGSDIDDALCLAYLLSQPECDLLGITTVSGEAYKRAELASVICCQAGKDIPIYIGVDEPLLRIQHQPHAGQHKKISKWEYKTEFSSDAIGFMRRKIYENPNEITLLAIGPLTNIALLFAMDRNIPSMLKELVIMGGRFKNDIAALPASEWNILCDPHAAQIVFSAMNKNMRCIGLDVTMQVQISKEEMMEKFHANILKPVIDFADVWFENMDLMTFHDPLAAAVIFDENICVFEHGIVDTELTSERLRGLTYWNADDDGGHSIATLVDSAHFFKHYFDTVNKKIRRT